jgi:hypothetical protein
VIDTQTQPASRWFTSIGRATALLVAFALFTVGCRGGEEGARPRGEGFVDPRPDGGALDTGPSDGGTDALDAFDGGDDTEEPEIPESERVLNCPGQQTFPFEDRLQTARDAYATDANRNASQSATFDTNPHLDWAGPAGGPQFLTGKISRTRAAIRFTPLPGEAVSLWHYDRAARDWVELDRTITDERGDYRFDLETPFGVGTHRTWAVFEAGRRCYPHNVLVWPADTQVIVTDIDGTLTLADEELFTEMNNPAYDQVMNNQSDRLIQTWADKGYLIIYLTARPGGFRPMTHAWLNRKGFPTGLMISADALVFGETARIYKRGFIQRARTTYGWNIVAAYGNADSDIQAYEDAGLPKNRTFIIGPEAGQSGTVAIPNQDWANHIRDFVERQPNATQPPELREALAR